MRIKGYVEFESGKEITSKGNADNFLLFFEFPFHSINNIAPKPRKILQLLRLLQINNGVFIKVSKATSQMLLLVEPYITYGLVNYYLNILWTTVLISLN